MDYRKMSYEELTRQFFENPPETPVCKKSFAELQRRRDAVQLRLSYVIVFFSSLVALNAVLQIVQMFR